MIGYTGEYIVSMDENGRLAIPARLRKARPIGVSPKKIVKGYVLAKWTDGCLGLFIESEWEKKLSVLLQEGSSFKRRFRVVSRHLSPTAYDVAPDNQGRITIPKRLIEAAGLKGEVLVSGVIQHIEIWDPQKFDKFIRENKSLEEAAEELFGD